MTVWVALLRGVNVGGHNTLPMAGFRDLLRGLGYEGVATYIQSGNAVFRAAGAAPRLTSRIAEAIEARFGFRPHVFVLAAEALARALDANPFRREAEEDGAKVSLHFLEAGLPDGALATLAPHATQGERAEARGAVLYLHAPHGFGRSDYARRLGRLKVPMTARNARTVAALVEMARNL